MASKKQRRRRQKDRRHEYEFVYVDEEGREVDLEEDEDDEPARVSKSAARTKPAAKATGRAGRVVEPPSWRRVGRRALLLGPILFVLMLLLKPKNATTAGVMAQALLFLIIFLPFSYLMDSMLYRSYLKRTGQTPTPGRRVKEPKPKT